MKRPIRANYITKYIMVSKWLPPINKEGFPLVAWRRLTTIYSSYSWLKTSISEGSIHRIFGFLSKKSAFYFTPPGDPSRIQSHLSTYSNTVRHPSVDGLFIPPKYNSLDTPSWLKTPPMQSQISTESNAFLIYMFIINCRCKSNYRRMILCGLLLSFLQTITSQVCRPRKIREIKIFKLNFIKKKKMDRYFLRSFLAEQKQPDVRQWRKTRTPWNQPLA